MSKASPGPWRWGWHPLPFLRGQGGLFAADGKPVIFSLDADPRPVNPADAALIALAPTMAKMLRELATYTTPGTAGFHPPPDFYDRLAALLSALPESP